MFPVGGFRTAGLVVSERLPSTAAAATTTATTAPATTTATAATGALLRLVDVDRAAAELTPAQLGDGLAGLLVAAHLDEREAARPTGLPIRHHLGVGDRAVRAEDFSEL